MLRKFSVEVIEAALAEQFSEGDETLVLKRVFEKELRQKNLKDYAYADKQKLAAKCARRGFRMPVIAKFLFNR